MTKRTARKKTRTGYRDASTGEFISEQSAHRRKPENVIKERIPLPGRGDTGHHKKETEKRKVKSLHKTGRILRSDAARTATVLRESASGKFVSDRKVTKKTTASGRSVISFRVKGTLAAARHPAAGAGDKPKKRK